MCLLGFRKVSQGGRVGDSCHMRLNEEDVGGLDDLGREGLPWRWVQEPKSEEWGAGHF